MTSCCEERPHYGGAPLHTLFWEYPAMFGLCPDCYRIRGANLAAMLSVKLWENPWNIDVSHPKPSWLGPKSYDFTPQLAAMISSKLLI